MPKRLSLKEHLARREHVAGIAREPSGSPVNVLLHARGDIAQPVTAAKLLVRHGLTLRQAHRVMNRLATGELVPVQLSTVVDAAHLLQELRRLGIEAEKHEVPETVDVRAIREKLKLSQAEFAVRFCFDPQTLRNWEQGRNVPDRYARALLTLIARNPAWVDAALAEKNEARVLAKMAE